MQVYSQLEEHVLANLWRQMKPEQAVEDSRTVELSVSEVQSIVGKVENSSSSSGDGGVGKEKEGGGVEKQPTAIVSHGAGVGDCAVCEQSQLPGAAAFRRIEARGKDSRVCGECWLGLCTQFFVSLVRLK